MLSTAFCSPYVLLSCVTWMDMRSIDLDNATYELQGLQMLESFDPETTYKLDVQKWEPSREVRTPGTVAKDNYNDLLS